MTILKRQTSEPEAAPALLDAFGQPARKPEDRACPRCGSTERMRSSGFGPWHDLCAGHCGQSWPEEQTAK